MANDPGWLAGLTSIEFKFLHFIAMKYGPSLTEINYSCGSSWVTVVEGVKKLEKLGLVTVDHGRRKGHGKTATYIFCTDVGYNVLRNLQKLQDQLMLIAQRRLLRAQRKV